MAQIDANLSDVISLINESCSTVANIQGLGKGRFEY